MEEFIIKLNELLVSEHYDERQILEISALIKEYLWADNCEFDIDLSEKKYNDEYNEINVPEYERIGSFKIYNPKIKISDFIRKYLNVYSSNLTKLYTIWERSYKDQLTDVYNNSALIDKIENNKEFNNVGVAFVDANGLGIINNTYGHVEGDKLLKAIADVMKLSFRTRDIYRKGGDEFVIVAEGITKDLFEAKINKVRQDFLNTPYSASIGSTYATHTDDLTIPLEEADTKMYVEKEEYRKLNPNKYSIAHKI